MTDALNIDALLGEQADRPLTYKSKTFNLPGELPGTALAPFLAPDLGLIELLQDALGDADEDANVIELVLDVLKKQPRLPLDVLDAGKTALRELLGDAGYDEFMALKPSVPALFLIARSVVTEYGMSLMDFFGSDESSEADAGGEPSKPTSSDTTDSTPEASGAAPDTPTS